MPMEKLRSTIAGERLFARAAEYDSDGNKISTSLESKQDVISDIEEIRSGAAAGATAYQKPASGIPASDMTSSVQDSLGLADTSIQPATLAEYASISVSGDTKTITIGQNTATIGSTSVSDTEFINRLDEKGIYATRADCDKDGNDIVETYATKTELAEAGGFVVVGLTEEEPYVPDVDSPNVHKIYLTKIDDAPGDDKYKEWICHYENDEVVWEIIGETTFTIDYDTTTFSHQIDDIVAEPGVPLVSVPDVVLVSQLEDKEFLARRAWEDENGNNIKDTYADKEATENAISQQWARFNGATGITGEDGIVIQSHGGQLVVRPKIVVFTQTAVLDEGTTADYRAKIGLNSYTIITVPLAADKLIVDVPTSAVDTLQEASFQFDVEQGHHFTFDVVTSDGGTVTRLKRIAPLSLTAGNTYQGTVVGGLCTLGEFEAVQ